MKIKDCIDILAKLPQNEDITSITNGSVAFAAPGALFLDPTGSSLIVARDFYLVNDNGPVRYKIERHHQSSSRVIVQIDDLLADELLKHLIEYKYRPIDRDAFNKYFNSIELNYSSFAQCSHNVTDITIKPTTT